MGTASGRDTLCVFIRLHNQKVNLEDRVKDVKTAFFSVYEFAVEFLCSTRLQYWYLAAISLTCWYHPKVIYHKNYPV